MSRLLYLDAPTGLAGDMLAAALIDAGAPLAEIRIALDRLNLPDWQLSYSNVDKNGLKAGQIDISFAPQAQARHLADILTMIKAAAFPLHAEQIACTAFTFLAEAEAAAHGCSVETVHFHEVGAVDSILDICTVALAVAALEIEEVYCSELPWSEGFVECAHGRLSTPVPAVRNLLVGYAFFPSRHKGELITPTGAALLRAIAARQQLPSLRLLCSGAGAGHRDLSEPNILRVAVGISREQQFSTDQVMVLTTNIDDADGEMLGMLWQRLQPLGLLDMSYCPLLMKKGRPGWQLTILAKPGTEQEIAQCLFAESSAIGLRIRQEQRLIMPRHIISVETAYGQIDVKISGNNIAPEYESCIKAAQSSGAAYKQVYRAAVKAAEGAEQ